METHIRFIRVFVVWVITWSSVRVFIVLLISLSLKPFKLFLLSSLVIPSVIAIVSIAWLFWILLLLHEMHLEKRLRLSEVIVLIVFMNKLVSCRQVMMMLLVHIYWNKII